MPVKPALFAIALALVGGCVTETQHATTTVTASWTLESLATGLPAGCPAGFEIARLVARPVAGGDPSTTDFPCADGQGVSSALAPAPYDLSIQILAAGGTLYAQSIPSAIDLSNGGDQRLRTTILDDAGYGRIGWSLVGATSGAIVNCDVGVDTIIVSATSATIAYVDQLPCDSYAGLTHALPTGAYTFFVTASHLGQGIGTAITAGGQVIGDRNQVTDVGSVDIALTGL